MMLPLRGTDLNLGNALTSITASLLATRLAGEYPRYFVPALV